MVAENIYLSIDDAGNTFTLLDELINHKSDGTAMTKEEATYKQKVQLSSTLAMTH